MSATYRVTDKAIIDHVVAEAEAIATDLNLSVELADPAHVERTDDGYRVLVWMPVPDPE